MKSLRGSGSTFVFRMAIGLAILSVLLAIPTALFAQSSPQPRDPGPPVVPRDEPYAGLTYPEWAIKWGQWVVLLPWTHNPLFDTTDCSAGQLGPVWFIDGKICNPGVNCDSGHVNRTCKIPSGKALLEPIWLAEDSFIEEPLGKTEADLRSFVKSAIDLVTNMSASIDGRPIQHLERYRMCKSGPTCTPLEAPLYTWTLAPTDNFLAATGEYLHGDPSQGLMPDGLTTEGVNDGYYLLVEPLSPGWHTIVIHVEVPAYGVVSDVTYHIQVVE